MQFIQGLVPFKRKKTSKWIFLFFLAFQRAIGKTSLFLKCNEHKSTNGVVVEQSFLPWYKPGFNSRFVHYWSYDDSCLLGGGVHQCVRYQAEDILGLTELFFSYLFMEQYKAKIINHHFTSFSIFCTYLQLKMEIHFGEVSCNMLLTQVAIR